MYYSLPYIIADETGIKASTLENRAEGIEEGVTTFCILLNLVLICYEETELSYKD